MGHLRERIKLIAPSPAHVLILGETGTGKELVATALAALSGCRPLVPVNCPAIPESMAESELFGHELGAFTGAVRKHTGFVERANGGILFLDELAELALAMQAKLLRTLESGEYQRVGGEQTLHSYFRAFAATSGDPGAMTAEGRLRADLIYRLDALRLLVPPLRERLDDIPDLAPAFLRRYREKAKGGPSRIEPEACMLLMQHDWPGNLRQLRNAVEASAALAGTETVIRMPHVLESLYPNGNGQAPTGDELTLAQARRRAEWRAILAALQRVGGNREQAARSLKISPATLYRKIAADSYAQQ